MTPVRAARGFSLIETLMVVVVLGLASVGISSMQTGVFAKQSAVKDLQVGARLMQECAEQVLAVRRFRQDGFDEINSTAFGTNLCGGVTALNGYTIPSVTLTDPYAGTGCPTGRACKLVSIAITQNSATPSRSLTPLTLMLVDY